MRHRPTTVQATVRTYLGLAWLAWGVWALVEWVAGMLGYLTLGLGQWSVAALCPMVCLTAIGLGYAAWRGPDQ